MHNFSRNENANYATQDECPMCGSNRIEVAIDNEVFEYGDGDQAVQLSARVPVHTCNNCSFIFTDDVAETLKHEAVCHHLGILTPNQISDLRASLGMTRSAFADLTGLGEASIGRWERGVLFQNKAADNLLRLISHKENVQRLLQLPGADTNSEAPPKVVPKCVAVFLALNSEVLQEKRRQARVFQLHPEHGRVH